jgi:aspartate-semialdehyde dehydrogenase
MSAKKKIALVGATGIAGQQFVAALADHPWFQVIRMVGSERSAGKRYGDALRDEKTGARRWWCDVEPPPAVLDIEVEDSATFRPDGVDLVFSAVEADVARELEPRYARTTPVVSTASAFRYEDDVPIIVPGVNWDHARLLPLQSERRGWQGYITPIPNCTTIGLALALKPIRDAFGVSKVLLTSMQGISGAGRSPGVVALDIVDNVVPFIPKEEEKVARETRKIFATLGEGGLREADLVVSATCTRASVLEGHTESVSVSTAKPATPGEIAAVMRAFDGGSDCPSAPKRWIVVHDDPFRPQPRLDRDAEGGMATSVGRIRPEPVLENGVKFVLVSHNTKMGAAKGAVLVAEHLQRQGLV